MYGFQMVILRMTIQNRQQMRWILKKINKYCIIILKILPVKHSKYTKDQKQQKNTGGNYG